MNQHTKKENHLLVYSLLDKSYHYKEGVIKINANNTYTHELAKFIVAWELTKNKQNFLTETIFLNGKRADLINLDNCEAIEITHTETDKRLLQKHNDYPIRIIALDATTIIKQYNEKYLNEKR